MKIGNKPLTKEDILNIYSEYISEVCKEIEEILPEQKKLAQYIACGEVKGTLYLLEGLPIKTVSPLLDNPAKMVIVEEIVSRLRNLAQDLQ